MNPYIDSHSNHHTMRCRYRQNADTLFYKMQGRLSKMQGRIFKMQRRIFKMQRRIFKIQRRIFKIQRRIFLKCRVEFLKPSAIIGKLNLRDNYATNCTVICQLHHVDEKFPEQMKIQNGSKLQ